MANDYCTISNVKGYLPQFFGLPPYTDTTWDAELTTLVDVQSRQFDRLVMKKPGYFAVSTPTTRYYDGPSTAFPRVDGGYTDERISGGYLANASLWIDEIAAVPTQVAVAQTGNLTQYTNLTSTDFICWPYNAPDDGKPYNRLDLDILYGNYKTWFGFRKGVSVTALFGWSQTAPAEVQDTVILMVIREFKRSQLSFADLAPIMDDKQKAYANLDAYVERNIRYWAGVTI